MSLALTGELTIMTAADRKADLLAAVAGGPEPLELELAAVTELDAAGLQLLLLAKREAAELGRSIRLVSASPAALEALAICGLDQSLDPLPLPAGGSR